MKINKDLTKYFYKEGKENLEKLQKMTPEEREEFYKRNSIINKQRVFVDKDDEMLEIFNVGTIRKEDGSISTYIDLTTGEKLEKVGSDVLDKIKDIPHFNKVLCLIEGRYYKSYNNIAFSHIDNCLFVDKLKSNNGIYFNYFVQFPHSDLRDEYYNREKRCMSIDAVNEDNKEDYSLEANFSYIDLDLFSSDNNGCSKIINIDCQGKRISCKSLYDVFVVSVDDQVKIYSSWLVAKHFIKQEIIDDKFVTEENIEEVMKPLFKMIESYIQKDFKKEKALELKFINGQKIN